MVAYDYIYLMALSKPYNNTIVNIQLTLRLTLFNTLQSLFLLLTSRDSGIRLYTVKNYCLKYIVKTLKPVVA